MGLVDKLGLVFGTSLSFGYLYLVFFYLCPSSGNNCIVEPMAEALLCPMFYLGFALIVLGIIIYKINKELE